MSHIGDIRNALLANPYDKKSIGNYFRDSSYEFEAYEEGIHRALNSVTKFMSPKPVRIQEWLNDNAYRWIDENFKYLLDFRRGFSSETVLMWAIKKGYDDLALDLIKITPQNRLADKNKNSMTALIYAASHCRSDVLKALIQKMNPEDLGLKDKGGNTALMFSIYRNQTNDVNALLQAMSDDDISLKNNDGRTAKGIAQSSFEHPRKHLIKAIDIRLGIIVEKKPEATAVNNDNKTTISDPRQLISEAIKSQSLTRAGEVGDQIVAACSKFFGQVYEKTHDSLASGYAASHGLQKLHKRIEKTQKSLSAMSQNLDRFVLPEGAAGFLKRITWAVIPWINPHRALKEDFNEMSSLISDSIDSSKKVLLSLEDFKKHYPELNASIEDHLEAFREVITDLNSAEPSAEVAALDPVVREQFRNVFQGKLERVHIEYAHVMMQREFVDQQIDTEIEFMNAVGHIEGAFNAQLIRATATISQLKSHATEELKARAGLLMSSHFDDAAKLYRIIHEERKALNDFTAKATQGENVQIEPPTVSQKIKLSPVS